MKSPDYWKKRSEQIARRQFIKADAFEIAQRKEYEKAIKSMQRDIEVFYQRYATNNEVTMSEARKQLTKGELKEFKMTLEEFTEKAKDNADGRWTQQLNNVYYKTRVTRLEALQTQIGQHTEILTGSRQVSTEKLLGDVYTDTYYRNIYEIQKGIGIGGSFAHVDDTGLKSVLESRLDGRNWSQRIWDDRSKVRQELQTKLSQSFIRGDSIDRTVKSVIERMSVSRSNAERLVQTESAFFAGQATAAGYKESGVVKQYEVLATLDTRTSSVCRGMDGMVFKLSEMEVNVNYPPFHARCRTTTVAYFDDESIGERIAMDPDGSTYYVPENMKYEEWYQKHVVDKYGQDNADIIRKKVDNQSADKAQFTQYKEVLGSNGPKSFAAFQDMKYTDNEGWANLKGDYRKMNAYQKIVTREPKITSELQDISKNTGAKLVGLDYRLKSKESYLRKVGSDSMNSLDPKIINDTISNTNDVIRYTYQANGNKLVEAITNVTGEMEAKGYSKLKLKNTWDDKRNPYKGVNGIYVSPDGQKFEVQFHTSESFKLKNGNMHKLYEEYRLDSTTTERRAEISKEMFVLSSKLIKPKDINKIK